MKRLSAIIATAALIGTLSFTAMAAGNANREIATALIHANVASRVDTVAGVHLHLHHVLNCVLGSHSQRYDAAAEALSANRCKGLGDGALPDADHNQAMRSALERAARAAERGVAAGNLAAAHKDAVEVVAALQSAQRDGR